MSEIHRHGHIYSLYYAEGIWYVRYAAILRDISSMYDRVAFETLDQALEFIRRDARHKQSVIDYADACCGGSINLAKQDLFGEDEEDDDE